MSETQPIEKLKEVVVIYHANCRDGFGSAYAAWTIFGDKASYIPRKTQEAIPEGLINKEIYILDYSYNKETLTKLKEINKKVVVIDHHETAKEAVESFDENIFSNDHSGAVLTWQYFHSDEPVPRLLLYIEDHDLWKMELEHTREFGAALGEYDRDFATWHQLNKNLEDRLHFNKFIEHGEIIARFEESLVDKMLTFREKVIFEGQEIYALNAERIYRSILGNKLSALNKSEGKMAMAIVYYRYDGMVHCSLRSQGEVDVSTIATKYGGGGHKNAASIRVANWSDLPFKFL